MRHFDWWVPIRIQGGDSRRSKDLAAPDFRLNLTYAMYSVLQPRSTEAIATESLDAGNLHCVFLVSKLLPHLQGCQCSILSLEWPDQREKGGYLSYGEYDVRQARKELGLHVFAEVQRGGDQSWRLGRRGDSGSEGDSSGSWNAGDLVGEK